MTLYSRSKDRKRRYIYIYINVPEIQKYENRLNEAKDLAEKKSFFKAKKILDELISEYPSVSEFYRLYGQILSEDGKLDESESYLINGLKYDPKNIWALVVLWNVYKKQGKNHLAKKLYKRAIDLDNKDFYALSNYWALCVEEWEYDEWEKNLLLALALNPEYSIAHYSLSSVYFYQGKYQQSFKQALSALRFSEDQNLNKTIMNVLLQAAEKVASSLDIEEISTSFISELEKKWGKKILIKEDFHIKTAAKVEVAEIYWREEHLVLYNSQKQNYQHLIMHELTHLKLIFEAREKNKNKVFLFSDDDKKNFIDDIKDDTWTLLSLLNWDKNALNKHLDFMCTSIGSQLFNSPIDLLIEKYLYETYADLQAVQFLNLLMMAKQGAIISNDKPTEKSTPKIIFDTNTILNIVLTNQLKDLYHIDLLEEYKQKKLLDIGNNLYNDFVEKQKKIQSGDEYDIVESWWKKLNLEKYFSFQDENKFITKVDTKPTQKIDSDNLNFEKYQDSQLFKKDFYSILKEEQDNWKFNEDELNMAVVMYCVWALQYYNKLPLSRVREISFELAMKGASGIDYSDTEKKYEISSIPGKVFTWLQFLSYMYVGFKLVAPNEDLWLAYEKEYELAKKIFEGH